MRTPSEIIAKLRDDYSYYAPRCLSILTKAGTLAPFTLNEAQRYLHARLEKQRAETGMVRALVLKGRQQGACLAPDTKVCRSDFSWSRIEDIAVGDRLLGLDEAPNGKTKTGRNETRRMRIAVVEARAEFRKELYEIKLSSGVTLRATADHRWLVRQRGGTYVVWRQVSDMRAGDHLRAATYAPDGQPEGFDDGWVGGALDADGSCARTGLARVAFSQVAGRVLDRYKQYLHDEGIGFYENIDARTKVGDGPRKLGDKPVHCIRVDRFPDIVKLLGRTRPVRFDTEQTFEGRKLPTSSEGFEAYPTIVSIRPLGKRRVVDIQTSTGTFVAEGVVSHNSTYITGRYYHKVSTRFGTRAFILTHEQQATTNLYAMVRRYHEHVPEAVKPLTGEDSAKSLYFSLLDSRFSLATAGAKETGRSATAQLFHGCLSPDSIIVTPDGTPVRMGDMKVGDRVRTHTGAVAPISFVSRNKDTALRVKVMGASEPLIATRQHKAWTQGGMAKLGTLDVGDCIGYPVSVAGNRHIEWPYRLDYGRRSGRGGAGSVGPDTLAATFDLGRMLGLYLAEGCVLKQSAGGNPSAVTFAIHEKEVARTVAWLAPFRECWRSEPKVTPRQSSKTVTVTVYSRSFAEFVLARCGELDDKKLPTEWRNNVEFAHGLVVGYFSGDGGGQFNKTTRRLQAPSIRGAISFGMRDALAALGYGWATVTHRAGAKRNGRDERAQWTVRLSGQGADRLWAEMGREELPRTRKARKPNMRIENGYAWLPITSIESAGEQSVMDFEIDHPDHSYCTWQGAVSNSEVAFWPNAAKHMAGIGQVVPEIEGTEIVLESTANGIGNLFHSMWQEAINGRSQYQAIFIPWYWEPGYAKAVPEGFMLDTDESEYMETYGLTMEQMVWRRDKIAQLSGDINLFNQEYPASAAMAFMVAATDALISPQLVQSARATGPIQGYGPLYMGVDPAEYGSDATAIIFRQGRRTFGLRRYHKKGPVEIAGIVATLIDEMKPDAVCVDATGGGGGVGVVDILRDQDYDVYAIRFGAGALDDRYKDRRTEMWANMLHWFQDDPVSIPQDDALAADLTSLNYTYNSARQLILESKEHAKSKRGITSPDSADAMACTFAVRVSAGNSPRGGAKWKDRLKSRRRGSAQAA